MVIWRPVMAGLLPLAHVHEGRVTLLDVLKLNAIMDAKEAAEAAAAEKMNQK